MTVFVTRRTQHTSANGKWLCYDCGLIARTEHTPANGKWLCMDCGINTSRKYYLFFDGKHPTVAGHAKLWDEIYKQVKAKKSNSIFTRLTKSAGS